MARFVSALRTLAVTAGPMTLPARECIGRFLQHVLPEGFHKVLNYGLWSPVNRPLLRRLQLCLEHRDLNPLPESSAPVTGPDAR
jgi:Putative transposase